jgi:hypothetical protein
MQLIRRIAEAEQAHGEDDHETLKLAKQLDLRRCPECSTIIEKNEGCSSMACYLCGHTFRWNDAKRVKKKKKVKTAETNPSFSPDGIPEGDTSRASLLRPAYDSDSDGSDGYGSASSSGSVRLGVHPEVTRVRPAAVEERSCVVM